MPERSYAHLDIGRDETIHVRVIDQHTSHDFVALKTNGVGIFISIEHARSLVSMLGSALYDYDITRPETAVDGLMMAAEDARDQAMDMVEDLAMMQESDPF